MSRLYTTLALTGRIGYDEDFATRASLERGVPININEAITAQDDPLLLALLERQRGINEAALVRWYAEHQALDTMAF